MRIIGKKNDIFAFVNIVTVYLQPRCYICILHFYYEIDKQKINTIITYYK